jgi:simple sugar transport system permease protein
LFFGVVYAVENRLEVSPAWWVPAPQLLQMAPYLLTLLVLAGLSGRSRAPSALGQPYEHE